MTADSPTTDHRPRTDDNHQFTNLPTYQSTNLPIYQSPIYQPTNLPIYQPTMDLGSIFLLLSLLILTALYIGRPLYERSATAVRPVEHELSALLAERDRVLNALSELDFDHALGKIPEDDYPLQRKKLIQRGAEVLRQLDEQGGA
ncbi:MAG: hypothetical protein KJ638_01630 [Chloroflexi bacterium]|nr:hypothetical protein [Chloroflexota bacterium]